MKLLLAPVLVTATKPLTPSHIKGLLWLDLLYKATATLHDVTYLSNRLSDDTTSQTISFWRYLDQKRLTVRDRLCGQRRPFHSRTVPGLSQGSLRGVARGRARIP